MKYYIANFKSNKNRAQMREWGKIFASHFAAQNSHVTAEVILCPPFSLLADAESYIGPHLHLGVQDLSPFPAGAYTGAVGAVNLEGFAVEYAILGHSERRHYFKETVQDIAKKVRESLSANIHPIVCVTKDQVNETANALTKEERSQVMVAFEPIEHIGTGTSDTLSHILETKEWVETAFGNVPYIYGGSVNLSTDPDIITSPEINGFLVGSASLDADQFWELLKSTSK